MNYVEPEQKRELTFGEDAVGLTFNPSNDENVQMVKIAFAKIIDNIQDIYTIKTNNGNKMASWLLNVLRTSAITSCIQAQMMVVKFITYNK